MRKSRTKGVVGLDSLPKRVDAAGVFDEVADRSSGQPSGSRGFPWVAGKNAHTGRKRGAFSRPAADTSRFQGRGTGGDADRQTAGLAVLRPLQDFGDVRIGAIGVALIPPYIDGRRKFSCRLPSVAVLRSGVGSNFQEYAQFNRGRGSSARPAIAKSVLMCTS